MELTLVKAEPGLQWKELDGVDEEGSIATSVAAPSSTGSAAHGYPSSSRKKTNWDAIAADVQKEEEKPSDPKDPNASGDVEVNKLFQRLYKDASDDQVWNCISKSDKSLCNLNVD